MHTNMKPEWIHIRGMVCNRCIATVQKELEAMGLAVKDIRLGEVLLHQPPADSNELEQRLKSQGFELLKDRQSKLVDNVKALVSEVYSGGFDFPKGFRFSQFVSARLLTGYETISHTFSAVQGESLEKYILRFRIHAIEEMLATTQRTLADLALAFGFSSAAHLSKQFRQVKGYNASSVRASHGANPAAE